MQKELTFLLYLALLCFMPNLIIATSYFESIGSLALSSVYSGLQFLRCPVGECCPKGWSDADLSILGKKLDSNLHGQHLVKHAVVAALSAHIRRESPNKSLVLSFHGWTGSGKNYVSSFIADSLFKKGMKSKFVHIYLGTYLFPDDDDHRVRQYKNDIREKIAYAISQCEHSLFIFDEVDKIPPGVLDAIKPFLDARHEIEGRDYRNAVFIFLSNTGGHAITEKALDFWLEGLEREDLSMKDMEELISLGAFNEKGGLKGSDIIDRSVIDHYVPFLPLEKQHVKMCARNEFLTRRFSPGDEDLEAIASEMSYGPAETPQFSKSGCKRVSAKVDLYLEERNWRERKREL